MKILLLLTVGMLTAGAGTAAGQKTSKVPAVFIEGFRTVDSLTRQAASELRAALAARVTPDRLRVLTTKEIDDERASGLPDDFGAPWDWLGLREVGRAYRADAIIDVTATKHGDGVTLRVLRVRPPKTGQIVELPTVRAPTLEQAVDILARRLAADSVLMRPAGK